MANNLPRFATLEDAKDYFEQSRDLSQKYGVLLCYVQDRYTVLMGTAMAEDNWSRGPLEEVVADFLNNIEAPIDRDDATHYCGAEMTGLMYNILAEYGIDVEFVYDTF